MDISNKGEKLDFYQVQVYCNIGFEMENSRIALTELKEHKNPNPLLIKRALEIANDYYSAISQTPKDFHPLVDKTKIEESLLYLRYMINKGNKKGEEEEALGIIGGLERISTGKPISEEVIDKEISFFEGLVKYTLDRVQYLTGQGHF